MCTEGTRLNQTGDLDRPLQNSIRKRGGRWSRSVQPGPGPGICHSGGPIGYPGESSLTGPPPDTITPGSLGLIKGLVRCFNIRRADRTRALSSTASNGLVGFEDSQNLHWLGVLEFRESLRVQHGITPPGTAANRVNNSTAAYLFGQCAVAWFTLALDASELIVNIDVDLDAFPGLVDGRFAPDMRKIRQIGNESRQGRTLAFAYLYSLAPEDEGAIDLLSPTFQERLAPECDAAPSNVRPFSSGIE